MGSWQSKLRGPEQEWQRLWVRAEAQQVWAASRLRGARAPRRLPSGARATGLACRRSMRSTRDTPKTSAPTLAATVACAG
jgi:hypothetical protein